MLIFSCSIEKGLNEDRYNNDNKKNKTKKKNVTKEHAHHNETIKHTNLTTVGIIGREKKNWRKKKIKHLTI